MIIAPAKPAEPIDDAPPRERKPRSRRTPALPGMGALVLLMALAPAVAAVWAVRWFVTQDSPAHIYNAEILARSFDQASPFGTFFAVRWEPIPNWFGHVLLAALTRILPAQAADRVVTTLALAGFAAAVYWLRHQVAGPGRTCLMSSAAGALLAAILAMNVTWLLGFTSFTLGACLFPITLGYWWPRRDDLRARDILVVGALLVLGYFCHLVSLGLTVVALGILALATPLPTRPGGQAPGVIPWRRLSARLVPLAVAGLPLVPLGIAYLRLASRGGPMRPLWDNLLDPLKLSSWRSQLAWADPITLMRKDALPLSDRTGPWFLATAPVLWLAAALGIWLLVQVVDRVGHNRQRTAGASRLSVRRGWWILAALLIVGGAVGPDTLGPEHGNYLPQRVVLCGLVALSVLFEIDASRYAGRAVLGALGVAAAFQSAIVWDYATCSDRTAGEVLRARDAIGRGRRVVFLTAAVPCRFRSNPMLHIDNWLGVESDNVVWGDYETRHYYFPVHFRAGLDRPMPEEVENLVRDGAAGIATHTDWRRFLARHADAIDVLVTYRSGPPLDAATGPFFRQVGRRGDVRILERDSIPRLAREQDDKEKEPRN